MTTEAQFQDAIVEAAHLLGWHTMHVRRTIGRGRRWTTGTSLPGWPDLALWRSGRFILAELKTQSGKLSDAQRDVLESLSHAGVDTRVWRPKDWPHIETALTERRAT